MPSSVYSVAMVLQPSVLLYRGRSRKSKTGVGGASSSSSTVMLLGWPTCSTEPGTKRVCWGPRLVQYRPKLKPFIHSSPWKMMEMGLSCVLVHSYPLSQLCTALPCSNLGTSQRCPRQCQVSQRSQCRRLAPLCPHCLILAGQCGASPAGLQCLWPGDRSTSC